MLYVQYANVCVSAVRHAGGQVESSGHSPKLGEIVSAQAGRGGEVVAQVLTNTRTVWHCVHQGRSAIKTPSRVSLIDFDHQISQH